MGWNVRLLSPDYPGVVRRVVVQTTGATCLFMTGAAGSQATLEFLQDDWTEMTRIGAQISVAAAQAATAIDTRPHHVERQLDASLSSLAVYRKIVDERPVSPPFCVASRRVSVPYDRLPRAEAMDFDIVGFRPGDFVAVGMLGEPFAEIGLAVKERSRARLTLFCGYCTGLLAYWPDPATVADRTAISVTSAVTTHGISAPPCKDNHRIIFDAFDALLSDLTI
jgi:hypothetical protein